jgi:hypothetical protein
MASPGPASNALQLISIPEDQLQQIHVEKVTGEVYDLKWEGRAWELTAPVTYPADAQIVKDLVQLLATFPATGVVDENASDIKQYGLDMPTLVVTVTDAKGKKTRLIIGDNSPRAGSAYAMLDGTRRVVQIAVLNKSKLDRRVDDLRDKHLLTMDATTLTGVRIESKGKSIEFSKNAAKQWLIVKPANWEPDANEVEIAIGKLIEARMDVYSPDPDPAKAFPTAAPLAVVTMTDAQGPHTLDVRMDKDKNVFVKSSTLEKPVRGEVELGTTLSAGLDTYRSKKIFTFGFADPNALEINGVRYTKTGTKWSQGDKAIDNTSIQAVIDKLRELAAQKFAPAASGPQIFTIAVTTGSGSEKVTITGQGSRYFAKRATSSDIYEVSNTVIEDLKSTVGSIKGAAGQPPGK